MEQQAVSYDKQYGNVHHSSPTPPRLPSETNDRTKRSREKSRKICRKINRLRKREEDSKSSQTAGSPTAVNISGTGSRTPSFAVKTRYVNRYTISDCLIASSTNQYYDKAQTQFATTSKHQLFGFFVLLIASTRKLQSSSFNLMSCFGCSLNKSEAQKVTAQLCLHQVQLSVQRCVSYSTKRPFLVLLVPSKFIPD